MNNAIKLSLNSENTKQGIDWHPVCNPQSIKPLQLLLKVVGTAALGMVCLPDPSLVRCFGHAQLGKDHRQNQGVVWERMRSVVGSE